MQKIKILYVVTKASWGGAQKYVYDLATATKRAGWRVAVATGAGNVLTAKLAEHNIPAYPLQQLGRDIKVFNDLVSCCKLWWLLIHERPEVVHLNSPKAGGLGALAARLAGIPNIVYTAHGWPFYETRPAWQRAAIKLFSLLTIWLCHRVIVISQTEYDAVANWPQAQSKLRLVYNGVSPINFLSTTLAREVLTRNLGSDLPDEALWVGTVAELHKNKGLEYGLQAFAQVAQTNPQLHWLIIGEGEQRARLEQIIKNLKLENRVFLLGHITDAGRLLTAFDFAMLPSIKEGLPYFILEAGQAGLPTLATKVGGVGEIITDHVSGRLVEPGNSTALAQALVELASDHYTSKIFGEKLRETVQKQFSVNTMVEQTLAVYNE